MFRASLMVALLAGSSAFAAPPRIFKLVLTDPVATGDVPGRALAGFKDALPAELRKLEGVSLMSQQDVREILSMERQKQLLGCGENDSCMIEVAGALEADELISVQLALVGATYTVSWKRTDSKAGKVLQNETRQFPQRDGEELLAIVPEMVRSMYPEIPLKPGRTRGVDPAVVRRLNPSPLPMWVHFTAVGGFAVAGATGLAFGALAKEAATQHNALTEKGRTEPVDGAEVQRLRETALDRQNKANICFAVAGGMAVAAVVTAFFTDWKNDRAALEVAPVVSGRGGGFVAAGRF